MIADLQNIKYVYFVGIGGIGMSALARWFNANGREVVGYDRSQTVLTKELESENIAIHYDDKNNSAAIHGNVDLIPEHFRSNKAQVLVIYTPAVPKNHSELLYFQQHGFTIKKRAEVLGLISQNMRCIAVAGTHGKTTTSSMIAHILTYSGVDCAAFLGGITQNYKTNLLLNKTQSKDTFVVVEADEYDRSFLQLFPEIAVITSTDADHLDIYGSEAEVQNSYATFATQVTTTLFANLHANIYQNSENITELQADLNLYALNPFTTDKGIFATNIHIKNARFVFNYVSNQVSINEITLIIPGFHNVENAVAAISVALAIGIDATKIKDALANFRGVKRRFEYIFESENHIQIDDYAHHPTEIRAFLESVRALYPNRHITAVFQPHLFSRTKDFYQDFAKSLSLADRLVLLAIYPARELQTDFPTINSQIILDLVTIQDKQVIDYQNVTTFLQTQKNDIVCTIGAGDVEGLIIPIKTSMDIN
jgi:UDP-N-acetylmuramate--alanine ligase